VHAKYLVKPKEAVASARVRLTLVPNQILGPDVCEVPPTNYVVTARNTWHTGRSSKRFNLIGQRLLTAEESLRSAKTMSSLRRLQHRLQLLLKLCICSLEHLHFFLMLSLVLFSTLCLCSLKLRNFLFKSIDFLLELLVGDSQVSFFLTLLMSPVAQTEVPSASRTQWKTHTSFDKHKLSFVFRRALVTEEDRAPHR